MASEGDPEAEVAPELIERMEQLASELGEHEADGDRAAKLEWIVNLLIMRGHLAESHRGMLRKIRANRRLPIVFGNPDLKAPDPEVDCASLIPLCRARCCSFDVALTADEVKANQVEWNLNAPYYLPKDPETGYCKHIGGTGGCTKYAVRPGTCRKYDCRDDKRIWLDFEARIPAPLPFDVAVVSFTADGEPSPD